MFSTAFSALTKQEGITACGDAYDGLAGIRTVSFIAGFASGNAVKENRIVGNGVNTAGIRLETATTGNVVKENILNGHSMNVDDQGTGNTVTENVQHRSLKCR